MKEVSLEGRAKEFHNLQHLCGRRHLDICLEDCDVPNKENKGWWRWCCPELCQGGLTLWLCWSGLCRENIINTCVQGQADLSGSTCSLWGPAALQASLEHSVKKAIFQVDYYHKCFHFGLLFLLYCLLYCLYILERIQIERSSLKMSRVVKWTTPEETKNYFCHWFYMLSGFGVCRRPTMSDYLVLCFASLESVKVLVHHIAVPKGSGESDQSQEVNDRKKLYESSGSIFFFIQFFPMVFRKWSSCWGVLASETRVFFRWVSLLPLQMYVFLCQLRSFSFLLGMVSAWVFLSLSWFISVKKKGEDLI